MKHMRPDDEIDEDGYLIRNGDDSCPNCRIEYDEIDHEYQICHHCGYNNNKPATGQ